MYSYMYVSEKYILAFISKLRTCLTFALKIKKCVRKKHTYLMGKDICKWYIQ